MSNLCNSNVEVLFQNKTFNISVDKKENNKETYNYFIEKLKSQLEAKDKDKNKVYKLMTINTKEMYLIINENNFVDILKENTKEGKIKFFLDIIEEKEENIIEPLDEDMIGGINKKNDEGDDFNEKLSITDSNEFNFNENNINNKNDNNKKEINSNNNNKENLKNEDLKMLITPFSSSNLSQNNNKTD